MRRLPLIVAALGFAWAAFGQSSERLTFEVASIKAAAPPTGGRIMLTPRKGGPGTDDPGRITWNNASLLSIIMEAYDVKRYQVTGPDWLDGERFDVTATVPAGATKEQVHTMWQNLLADRWGVVVHHDSKVFPVQEMVVAKGGPKLKETDLDAEAQKASPPPITPGTPPKFDPNGFPQLPGAGLIMMMTIGPNGPNARMVARAQTMAQLAGLLGNQLNQPVVDKTGLTGKYDFALEFAPDQNVFKGPGGAPLPPPPGAAAGPGGRGPEIPGINDPTGVPLPGALQQQLGLRLQSTKAPLDVVVVDKINKTPTEN